MPRSAGPLVLLVLAAGCMADAPTSGPGPSDGPEIDGHPVSAFAWSALPAGPTPRTEVVVGQLGQRFYVIGGFTADSQALLPTNLVEVFDAKTQTWSRGPDYPIPIHHSVAVKHASALYVLGGMSEGFVPTPAAFALEDGAAEWTPLPPLPEPRGSHAAAVIGDKIYLAGGVGVPSGHVAHVVAFDTQSQAWTTIDAAIPTPRDHTAGAAFAGRFFVAAGDVGGHDENTNATESFDPATNRWTRHAGLPTLRGSVAAVEWRDRIVVLGGQNGTQTFDAVEAFDPINETWIRLLPMREARHGFGAGVLDDSLYVFYGGPKPGLSVMSSVERLDLVSGSTFAPT